MHVHCLYFKRYIRLYSESKSCSGPNHPAYLPEFSLAKLLYTPPDTFYTYTDTGVLKF